MVDLRWIVVTCRSNGLIGLNGLDFEWLVTGGYTRVFTPRKML